MYFNDLIKILIVLSLIFTFIFIPSPFIKYLQMTHIGEVLVETIQREGAITNEVDLLFDQLCEKYNINPSVEYHGDFNNVGEEKRIQLKEKFRVILKEKVKVFSFLPSLSNKMTYFVNLSKEIVGVSHYYWREDDLQ